MTEPRQDDWGARTVGEIVAEDFRRAAVFQAFGIDFCCGGGRSVRAAAEGAGADPEAVGRALAALERRAADPGTDPAHWPLDDLARHIVAVHHVYVREALPVLRDFTERVAGVHGQRHPELATIRDLVAELAEELERHMTDEEEVLFPRIASLASDGRCATEDGIRSATLPLEDDHARAGELMRRIRALSDGFAPPADACTTYRATYAKLAEFEGDLHRHVHLENNVFFPRAALMEAERASAGARA